MNPRHSKLRFLRYLKIFVGDCSEAQLCSADADPPEPVSMHVTSRNSPMDV